MTKLPPIKSPADKSLVRRLLEMIRFSHTVFALPFALLACVWAYAVPFPEQLTVTEGQALNTTASIAADTLGPTGSGGLTGGKIALRLLGVLLCMVSARSAAMSFNRLVDVNFDADNPRTAGRHLVTGELSRGQVWAFFTAMVLMFFFELYVISSQLAAVGWSVAVAVVDLWIQPGKAFYVRRSFVARHRLGVISHLRMGGHAGRSSVA